MSQQWIAAWGGVLAMVISLTSVVVTAIRSRAKVERERTATLAKSSYEALKRVHDLEATVRRIGREQHAPRDAWRPRTPQDATPDEWAARHLQDRRTT